jgi:hypothetical protein
LKLLEENIGKTFLDLNNFMNRIPVAQKIRVRIDNGVASISKASAQHRK